MYLRGLVSWSRMPGCPSYKKIMKCLGDRNEETENHTDKSKGVGNGIQKIQDSSCINGDTSKHVRKNSFCLVTIPYKISLN